MQHLLPYPTSETFACGADAVGRRNTRTQTDLENVTCLPCRRTARDEARLKAGLERLMRDILE